MSITKLTNCLVTNQLTAAKVPSKANPPICSHLPFSTFDPQCCSVDQTYPKPHRDHNTAAWRHRFTPRQTVGGSGGSVQEEGVGGKEEEEEEDRKGEVEEEEDGLQRR